MAAPMSILARSPCPPVARAAGAAPADRHNEMVNVESTGTAPAETGRTGPDNLPQTGSADRPHRATPGVALLAVLAVVWLAGMLWSARSAITTSVGEHMSIISTAYALPGVISAGLVAGAAIGLSGVQLLNRRGADRAAVRFTVALGAGLVVGVLAALLASLGVDGGAAVTVLAGATAAAATIGGAVAGVRLTPVVAAVVGGTLAVFAVGFALSFFQDSLLSLYGAGKTQSSQVTALNWFSRTASVGSGLAAGLAAFGYLRLARRRAVNTDSAAALRWPAYLVAGLGAGLLLLVAEILTRTAGAQVLAAAGALSEADQAAQRLLGAARITHSLIVLFIGGLVALIALGRTLGPAEKSGPTAEQDGPTDD